MVIQSDMRLQSDNYPAHCGGNNFLSPLLAFFSSETNGFRPEYFIARTQFEHATPEIS